ncbi:hypothetical protein QAD02_003569 [Eretmocerus hayati]|uniref:Uncharacterized protein n=1 Tax=Eretmocerus hayati TaxID=131215 RepID=A0ACC2NM25_9HYME|nr:hypothetical protein QAD02_003569 [Eretmocerus hayati]
MPVRKSGLKPLTIFKEQILAAFIEHCDTSGQDFRALFESSKGAPKSAEIWFDLCKIILPTDYTDRSIEDHKDRCRQKFLYWKNWIEGELFPEEENEDEPEDEPHESENIEVTIAQGFTFSDLMQ